MDGATLELETIPRPLWVNPEQAEAIFGISAWTLRKVVKEGHVRSAKVADTQQAPRVYHARDLHEWLLSRATKGGTA